MNRWLVLFLVIGLNAATCGQKGPLYRPEPVEPETHAAKARDEGPRQAGRITSGHPQA